MLVAIGLAAGAALPLVVSLASNPEAPNAEEPAASAASPKADIKVFCR